MNKSALSQSSKAWNCTHCGKNMNSLKSKSALRVCSNPVHALCSSCKKKTQHCIVCKEGKKDKICEDPYESQNRLMLSEEGIYDDFKLENGLNQILQNGSFLMEAIEAGAPQRPSTVETECRMCGEKQTASDSPVLRGGHKPYLLYTHCGREQHRLVCSFCFLKIYECPFCNGSMPVTTNSDNEKKGEKEKGEKGEKERDTETTGPVSECDNEGCLEVKPEPEEEVYLFRVHAPTGVSLKKRKRSEQICEERMGSMFLKQESMRNFKREEKRRKNQIYLLKLRVFLVWLPIVLIALSTLGFGLIGNELRSCQHWGGYQQCRFPIETGGEGGKNLKGSSKQKFEQMCCPPSQSLCGNKLDSSSCNKKSVHTQEGTTQVWILEAFLGVLLMLAAWIAMGVRVSSQIRRLLARQLASTPL